jgi:hypothetical protein
MLTTEHDPLPAIGMRTPAKDSLDFTTEMKASGSDEQPSKQQIEVWPNKLR